MGIVSTQYPFMKYYSSVYLFDNSGI